jgi:uncharacterized protein YaiL (DUF2058 family)
MQNLRDKLLKAGLVTSDQVKKAEEKGKPKERPRPDPKKAEEERQRREAYAAHEAEVAEQRRKEQSKVHEARMQSERAHKLRALVAEHRFREAPGEVHFHYVKRSGKIGRLALSADTAGLLERGEAAVVEDPGQPECVVVPSGAAEKFYAVDPKSIRFWAGPRKPVGFEDVGATEAEEA